METVLDQQTEDELKRSQASNLRRKFQIFVSKCLSSTSFYFRKALKIKTKSNQLVSFELNPIQKKLLRIIIKCKKQGLPIRLIVLKARQMGCSTLTEAYIFKRTALKKFVNSIIVCHDIDSSQNLFGMTKRFYQFLPRVLKPMVKYTNRKELIFENPNPEQADTNPGLMSQIVIDTAKNAEAGRSFTIHNFHGSEVAFWGDRAHKTFDSIMQSVPDDPETFVCLESTANGIGGLFHEEWQRAKSGESGFIPVFFAWFDDPTYVRKIRQGDWNADKFNDFISSLDEEEISLRKKYDLTLEQINWRRWCVKTKCRGKIETFRQEYPSNDIEAFIASGRCPFDKEAIHFHYLPLCKDPVLVGDLIYNRDNPWHVQFVPKKDGIIKIWRLPEKDHFYAIGGDVAEGLEHGDNSDGVVIDYSDMFECASINTKIDPDLFAVELYKLGLFYRVDNNYPCIASEANLHGVSVNQVLRDGHARIGTKPYPNLYFRIVEDERTRKKTKKFGFLTNKKTRPLLIDTLETTIREKVIRSHNKEFFGECLSFIKHNGKLQAEDGCNDDRIISRGICLVVMSERPAGAKRIVKKLQRQIRSRAGY